MFGVLGCGVFVRGMFGMFGAVLGVRRVIGMGRVFPRIFLVARLVMGVVLRFCRGRLSGGRIGQGHRRQRLARVRLGAPVIGVNVNVIVPVMVMLIMGMLVVMMLVITMLGIGVMIFGVMCVAGLGVLADVVRLGALRRIGAGVLDDLALDALAIASAARIAVARAAAAAGAVFALLLGLAMGALVGLDQRLAIGDRNLVIVRMDFAEGEEAVAIAAILDEGRLQRRLYARDLGEVDIAAQLLALGGLEIKLFDAIAADHDDPGLFRVGGIDQHFVGHFGTLGGGGRVSR